jgi:Ca2+/H+ antiporter
MGKKKTINRIDFLIQLVEQFEQVDLKPPHFSCAIMMVILYFIAIFTSLVTHSYSSALENHRNVEEIEINCEKFIDENGVRRIM